MTGILIAFFAGLFIGYLWGRFILLKRMGKSTMFVPQRLIKAQNVKAQGVYKAAANQMKRDRAVLVQTKDPEKVKKQLAKAAGVVPEALSAKETSIPGQWSIFYNDK